jgi:hypothetical protein
VKAENRMIERNLIIRIIVFFLWLIVFEVVAGITIGQLVLHFSGENFNTEQGQVSAHLNYMKFMASYGALTFIVPAILVCVLAFFRILPAIGKYKKFKNS